MPRPIPTHEVTVQGAACDLIHRMRMLAAIQRADTRVQPAVLTTDAGLDLADSVKKKCALLFRNIAQARGPAWKIRAFAIKDQRIVISIHRDVPLSSDSNLRVRTGKQLRQVRTQLPRLDGSINSTDDCRHSLSRNAPSLQPLPNVWLLYAATACKFGLIALTQGEDRLQRLAALGSVGFRCSHSVLLCGGEHAQRLQPSE